MITTLLRHPLGVFTVACLAGLTVLQAQPLPRSTPEAQGVHASAIDDFLEAANEIDSLHSFMMLRHGRVIAEGWWAPYQPDDRHKLYSLSKSFASTAVGLAIAEGKLDLHDTVMGFFPDLAPGEPSRNLKNLRVRDLLSMSTGHVSEDLGKFSFTDTAKPLVQQFLALPVKHRPGTHFLYNTPATYLCSAIVQKVTGQGLIDYLTPRLFEPLGIEGPVWETDHQGIALGGYGLNVRTEDIAKFGQLYLQRGEWNGRRLLPADWIEAATRKQTSNGSDPESDWNQGYGFQFWRCRHNAYRGDGAFGQYCVVMPEHDVVIAITSGLGNMQGVLDRIWDHLLPGLAPIALPSRPEAHAALRATLESLAISRPQGDAGQDHVREHANRIYHFAKNDRGLESFELRPMKAGASMILTIHGTAHRLTYGYGQEWVEETSSLGPTLLSRGLTEEAPIARVGAWPDADTLVIKSCFTRSPYVLTLTASFQGDDTVDLNATWNVAFSREDQNQTFQGKTPQSR